MSHTIKTNVALILGFVTVSSCAPTHQTTTSTINSSATGQNKVVYGQDGRFDIYQVGDPALQKLADSTVALVQASDLTLMSSTGTYKLQTVNFAKSQNLCPQERFGEQNLGAFCSGSLVSENMILTAGHCITSAADCSSTKFIFGFGSKAQGPAPENFNSDDIYSCQEIIDRKQLNNGADYALIRLDRKVSGHSPLGLRRSGQVSATDELVVIGHPVGLPTKVTMGGTLRPDGNSQVDFFTANLDTYGGNSGSAVINRQTGLIEGVLVRGENDFVNQLQSINGTSKYCQVSQKCTENSCRGEDVTRISVIAHLVPNVQSSPNPPDNPTTPVAQPEVFAVNVKQNIPDNSSAGVTQSLNVPVAQKGRKVFLKLSISHSYIGDLSVSLQAPTGQIVTIHKRSGGSADNINKTYDLSSLLKSDQPSGLYKLSIKDLSAKDTGTINMWQVIFRN